MAARAAILAAVLAGGAAAAAAQGEGRGGPVPLAPVISTQVAPVPPVDSAPLGQSSIGAAGLLPPSMTGLPVSLWRGSDAETLARMIAETEPALPALAGLMRVLMLAEADPPQGASSADDLGHLAARLDWLIAHGAVDEALAVIEIAGTGTPALFDRWADLTLLLGRVAAPCRTLAARPGLSDAIDLRVFCIARAGDWPRAATVLGTARVLGTLPERQLDLLERYLDPALAEARPSLPPPVRPTPLQFRLYEAIGEPLPTGPLPLPFAVLDLDGHAGWRAEIAAAERLARAGAVPPNQLLGLYTRQAPAASGGVWDRVAAFQALERALAGDARPDHVGPALIAAWPQFASARLLVPFATLFAADLAGLPLPDRAARLATRAAFLAPEYEALAARLRARDPETAFLAAIARGDAPAPETAPDLPHADAVARAFADSAPPDGIAARVAEGRLGEAILEAIALFDHGAAGDPAALTRALSTLRAVGLEDTARRAALQVMVLSAERALR